GLALRPLPDQDRLQPPDLLPGFGQLLLKRLRLRIGHRISAPAPTRPGRVPGDPPGVRPAARPGDAPAATSRTWTPHCRPCPGLPQSAGPCAFAPPASPAVPRSPP